MTITHTVVHRHLPQQTSSSRVGPSSADRYERARRRRERDIELAEARMGRCEHCGERSFRPWCKPCLELSIVELCSCTGTGNPQCAWVRMLEVMAAGNRFHTHQKTSAA
jgi:hypothetical protein